MSILILVDFFFLLTYNQIGRVETIFFNPLLSLHFSYKIKFINIYSKILDTSKTRAHAEANLTKKKYRAHDQQIFYYSILFFILLNEIKNTIETVKKGLFYKEIWTQIN